MAPVRWILTALPALALVACDSFDFGRVTGDPSQAPSAAPRSANAAPSAAPSAARTPLATGPLVIALGGELSFPVDPKAKKIDETTNLLGGLGAVLADASMTMASLESPVLGRSFAATHAPALDVLVATHLAVLDVASPALVTSTAPPYGDTLATLAQTSIHVAGGAADPATAWKGAKLTTPSGVVTVIAALRPPAKGPKGAGERVAMAQPDPLAVAVKAARAESAAVIVSLGGAAPGVETLSEADSALARAAIAAGADVVVSHGSRTPLGVVFVSGHPVLLGLGSLSGGEDPKDPWTSRGFVAKVTIPKGASPLVDLCPYLVEAGAPKMLSEPSRSTQEGIFRRALQRLSTELGPVVVSDPDAHSCFRVTEAPPAEAAH